MEQRQKSGLIITIVGLIIALGSRMLDVTCSGWNVFNPLCQFQNIGTIVLSIILLVIGVLVVIIGLIMVLFEDYDKILFFIMLAGLVASLTIFNWIPVVDEALTGLLTLYYGIKAFGNKNGGKK